MGKVQKIAVDDSIFKMAVENAFNHIIITNTDGIIIYANKAVKKITEYDPKEVVGKTPAIWGGQMPAEFYKKLWKTIKTDKKPFTADVLNRKKGGKKYIAKTVISPILKNKKIIGYIGTEEDITKQKQIDQMKSDFISITSHELRTPLTAIKGFASMILDGDFGEINKSFVPPLKDILLSTNRLIGLVNNLLSVSRIEAGRMKFTLTDFDLGRLIREIIELLQPISQQQKTLIKTEGKIDYSICADRDKTREILNNLIGNALKFTNYGKITITVKKMKTKKDFLDVFIKDTGFGIRHGDQTRLFSEFGQVFSQKHGRPHGSGLGLYISKLIAKKMSGDLWLEHSEINKGSTFAFSLPLTGTLTSIKSKLKVKNGADQIPD